MEKRARWAADRSRPSHARSPGSRQGITPRTLPPPRMLRALPVRHGAWTPEILNRVVPQIILFAERLWPATGPRKTLTMETDALTPDDAAAPEKVAGPVEAAPAGSACRPTDGQECVIHHRGMLILATWMDASNGGYGAWRFDRNGAWIAVPSQVTRWWPLDPAAAFRPPNSESSGR